MRSASLANVVDVAAAPLLSLSEVTKRFGGFTALSEVSLDLRPGEVHCILGENGAGKSTLCNVIFGVYQPDGGAMTYRGAPYQPSGPADALAQGIAMVHQHFSLVGDMTVVDNVLLGRGRGVLNRKECARQLARLGEDYGLPLDPFAKIDDLSVGERQRVEIVKCLIRDPQLFVLDEPTAVLLPDEIASLLAVCRRVAASGRAVVLVTHKLAEIKEVADRVTVLRGGRTVVTSDAPTRDIDMLVRAMIHGDVAELDGAAASTLGLGNVEPVGRQPPRSKVEALQIDGLTVRDRQGVTRLDNFTLTVDRGEIVGVAGVEGNGQSELAAVLAGMVTPTSGRYYLGETDLTGRSPKEITAAGVGIVSEDRHAVGCVLGMSLAENIYLNRLDEFTRFGFLNRTALQREATTLMQRFDVRARGPGAPFSSLSGGNQQKAVLAREITLPNLSCLVASQPTRGLDVGAVAAVYGHIRDACSRGIAVLLVSSELDELLSVADRIVVLYRGRIMGTCAADVSRKAEIGAMMAGQAQ
ncbi:ABC transporter ATP-binding protein [Rhodopseudomonas sp. BR0M22]|uniref:ABC transporter ATP-binding protein n=1 Tax=Rhodopseudomonas sp. BR0M22 TaxID=2269369 RepID=UPI0013E0D5CF|nr:ABC transporter ATP-binding protein [Rhodopseudomonas sp. BR0M22]NEW91191.1 ABC transporter ATP-binding protein [Rhodopseudomonas sp. BR0M22]